jgi:hypothetical protein
MSQKWHGGIPSGYLNNVTSPIYRKLPVKQRCINLDAGSYIVSHRKILMTDRHKEPSVFILYFTKDVVHDRVDTTTRAGQGKLRLCFGEQLDEALARFGRVTIEFQKLPVMLDIEMDDVCIFRH